MKANQTHRARPRLGLGPFTILAFVLASFFAYQAFASGRIAGGQSAGTVVFEADDEGKLRRVASPKRVAQPSTPLWKPQPSLLLGQAYALQLSPGQRQQILAVERAWQAEMSSLERSLEAAFLRGTGANRVREQGQAIPAAALMQGMSGYAELSSLYNERRQLYWSQAVAVLTPPQQRIIEQVRMGVRR